MRTFPDEKQKKNFSVFRVFRCPKNGKIRSNGIRQIKEQQIPPLPDAFLSRLDGGPNLSEKNHCRRKAPAPTDAGHKSPAGFSPVSLFFNLFGILLSRNAFARLVADRAAGLAGGLTGASALAASGYFSFCGFCNGLDHDKNPPDCE